MYSLVRVFNRPTLILSFFLYNLSLALSLNLPLSSAPKVEAIATLPVLQEKEHNGDYATALSLAQGYYRELLKTDPQLANAFLPTVERLEHKLLTLGASRLLFNDDQEPRSHLIDLLKLLGMKNLNTQEPTIVQINRWAQIYLLRQNERWCCQIDCWEGLRPKLECLLERLGLIKATYPHFKEYQGVIVLGSLLSTSRKRLCYLIDRWKSGVTFSTLYFLSSERPLNLDEQSQEALFLGKHVNSNSLSNSQRENPSPKTECEMLQFIWEHSDIPDEMRSAVRVIFVNAPMKKDPGSEKLLRPNTDDTVNLWLSLNPEFGKYLVISNAPYTPRQDVVLRTLAPDYLFETVGPRADREEHMGLILDELARFIFQTKLSFEVRAMLPK